MFVSGIMNTEGKMWKEQRRFLHERLRHFGIKHAGSGREMMEARIMVIMSYHLICTFHIRNPNIGTASTSALRD